MTYSIVARDTATGQLGVAVQTFNLAVGAWVPWAEGGVGAVATQALAERSYGTLGLNLMRDGKTAPEALAELLAVDEKTALRQVSMIDHQGNIATHTGDSCFPEAGSFSGDNFCVQANMMLRNTVWDAMAEAYQNSEGDLAGRMMAALEAAQEEGGDMRGQQTAALLVVDSGPNAIPLVSLRVDHDPEPLIKMRQLLRLHRAYDAEYATGDALAAGDIEAAHQLVDRIKELAPEEEYLQYLRAMHLAGKLDRWDEALEELKALIHNNAMWKTYLQREATVDNFGIPGLGKRLLDVLNW